MKLRANLLLAGIGLLFFIAIALRAYGYYTNDQSIFLLFSDAHLKNGTLKIATEAGNTVHGNFHPPLVMLLLAFFLRFVSMYAAPSLLIVITTGVSLFFLIKTVEAKDKKPDIIKRLAMLVLFFLLPMTHQNALFLDIDNSVLVAWSSVVLYWMMRHEKTVKYHLVMVLIFATGFWCKLTTPPVVLVVWCLIESVRHYSVRNCVLVLMTAILSVVLFIGTYAISCHFMQVPFGEPFRITFGKFLGSSGQVVHPVEMVGNGLRCIYYDIHWFTPVLFILMLFTTSRKISCCIRGKLEFNELYPHILFWVIWVGYTFVVPAGELPRYKYSVAPFLIIALFDDFFRFFKTLTIKNSIVLVCAAVVSMVVLPDFGTSGMYLQLRYHWFSILPITLNYYPDWFVALLDQCSRWGEVAWWLYPLRVVCFLVYYLSLGGIIQLLLYSGMIGVFRLLHVSFLRSLFFIALVLWSNVFLQDMSREYQLFYDAGYKGFDQTVDYLKRNLQESEAFLGYRDLALYTGHPAYTLYNWKKYRCIDTSYIDSIGRMKSIRFIAFLNDKLYNDPVLYKYLGNNCIIADKFGDYRVYRFVR